MTPVQSPLISVVVPLFNKRAYVLRCLESIARQTVRDFEAIVVDDGSTDGSGQIAQEFDDHRFHVIVQPNRGEGAARNRGIAEARAKLIAFLDADDEWEPGFLEAILGLAHRFPEAGILATGFRRCYDTEFDKETTLYHRDEAGFKLVRNYFHLAQQNDFFLPSSVALPARVLDDVGRFLEGEPIGCDRHLWARIALRYPTAYDNRILARYNLGAAGRISDTWARAVPFPIVIRHLWSELDNGAVPNTHIADVKDYIDCVAMQYAYSLLYHRRRAELGRFLDENRFHSRRCRLEALLLWCALQALPMRVVYSMRWRPLLLLRWIRRTAAISCLARLVPSREESVVITRVVPAHRGGPELVETLTVKV